MKVLQLCHKPPFPAIDGGCIAMKNISCGLIDQGAELHVLTIETDKHPYSPESIPEQYKEKINIKSVYVDTNLNLVDAFSNLITSDSYNVSRFFTPDVDIELTRILQKEKFDVIHLESLFVTPYIGTIRRNSKAKIYLRSHNMEYMIWERLATKEGNPAKKFYLNILAKQLKRYEVNTLNDIDGVISISSGDEAKYRKLKKDISILNLPFAVVFDDYEKTENIRSGSFFHLGSLTWKPNLEGIQWFLKNVWPKYYKKHPEHTFYLAGRDIPQSIYDNCPKGVQIVGEVEDARAFIKEHGVMIVPLRAAGGIRVKIIEGMALGIPIISTKVGGEGIDYTHDENILIADTAGSFVTQMEQSQNPGKFQSLGTAARNLIETNHDNERLSEILLDYYKRQIDS